jgi:cyclic pyranopterin phosphate synthase
MGQVKDSLGRPIRDLRVSVTDRCNFRCKYCMPAEIFGPQYPFLPKGEILTFEEITRLAKVFSSLGTVKLRITGGEPLLRQDLPLLVKMLCELRGYEDIALTTNGYLLSKYARELFNSGLERITVSLDSLEENTFKYMNGGVSSVKHVTKGIETAISAGLFVKINVVVQKGVNEDQIIPIAEYGNKLGINTRFIEFMDVGNHNQWIEDKVFSARDILKVLKSKFSLEAIGSRYRGEVAQRYKEKGSSWEIGLISSITKPFCRDCSRARVSADGHVFTCLFGTSGFDIRSQMRKGIDDDCLVGLISKIWTMRKDKYSEDRSLLRGNLDKVEMHHIGG